MNGEVRVIDDELSLVPYYPCPEVTLPWYQDLELCRQVDNIDHTYSLEELENMYAFLCTHGLCYLIQYKGKLVGDVTLRDNAELAIVIARDYQNRHIGRRCILEMIRLAKEKGWKEVKANIYCFNHQSQRMFLSLGFRKVDEEWFTYEIK